MTEARAIGRPWQRVPDERLQQLVESWQKTFERWLRLLDSGYYRHSYAYANEHYEREIVPLLREIAATPAETEAGFEAKLRILVEDDICTVLWHACQVRGTQYASEISAGQPEPVSKNPTPSHRKIRWAKPPQ